MNDLIKFELDNGDFVWIEVEDTNKYTDDISESEASRTGEAVAKANQTFQDAISLINPVAENLIKTIKGISDRPDEISIEFGLKVSGKVGTVIATSSVDANFKVSLKWTHDKKKK